jgi:hypothetical protein
MLVLIDFWVRSLEAFRFNLTSVLSLQSSVEFGLMALSTLASINGPVCELRANLATTGRSFAAIRGS